MEELIFFAVIIVFSIVESMARSRKAKQKAEGGGETSEPELFEWAQKPPWEEDAEELPTYDEDPTYDDVHEEDDDGIPGEPLPQYSRRGGTPSESGPPPAPKAPASLADASAQIFAELQKLGLNVPEQTESPPLPMPEPPDERSRLSVETRSREVDRSRSRVPTAPRSRTPDRTRQRVPQEHRVHLSHAGYGTDPSSRAPSEQDGMDPLARYLGADAAAVRERLLSDNASALRQAIILHEVLGPPVGLRDEQ